MGFLFSKLYSVYEDMSKDEPSRIMMMGLDSAGKTTILYKLKLNETVSSIPTIGFNVETVSPCKGVTFTVWDMGGQAKIKGLWHHYYQHTRGLIFVVDSTDRDRMQESHDELNGIMECDQMKNVPFVVLANKQDLPGALQPHQIIKQLNLSSFSGHKWHVQASCAITGEGLYEGMDTMARMIKEQRRKGRYS